MSADIDPKVCLREYRQRWDSEAVSQWGAAWNTKAIDTFVAKVSKRMAWRGNQRPGQTFKLRNLCYLRPDMISIMCMTRDWTLSLLFFWMDGFHFSGWFPSVKGNDMGHGGSGIYRSNEPCGCYQFEGEWLTIWTLSVN